MSTTRLKILFVDDDPAILNGLQNVLYRDRARWEMEFALGGVAALAKLSTQVFDAVVSDMRMPEVDGAAVLANVREVSPSTKRIMLSGSTCETEMPDVDELLSKPCDAKTLRATLEKVFRDR